MPKWCKCGGRFILIRETSAAFTVRCDKCHTRATQHKKRKKGAW